MNWEDDIEPDFPDRRGPEDDQSVQMVEGLIEALFVDQPNSVFYETQLCIRFEKDYFHWVTARALKELREGNRIGSELQELNPGVPLRFYFSRRNRYWKRRSIEIRALVRQFSEQTFTNALGLQGELLIDAGLPIIGFMPQGRDIKAWDGKTWEETNHNLDRVFTCDGIAYGAEIKNRLSYISRDEFNAKLGMCAHMGLVPLFIARMMPKTYIEQVRAAGGFSWIMKYQFYPASHRDLAAKVRSELELPVDCPARLQDATLQRLLNWHESKRKRSNT